MGTGASSLLPLDRCLDYIDTRYVFFFVVHLVGSTFPLLVDIVRRDSYRLVMNDDWLSSDRLASIDCLRMLLVDLNINRVWA